MAKASHSIILCALVGVLATALLAAPKVSTSMERGDRGSRLLKGESASEYWDIVADFDNSYSLFVRFSITNEGPGKHTAFATWYLVDPAKKLHPFKNGRREGDWSLSSGGRRIKIGSSLFDQSGDEHRIEYNSNKRETHIRFRFTPKQLLGWTDSAGSEKYSIDLLDLGTPVTGTIQLKGMSEPLSVTGTLSVTHTWMEESETDLALRRIEFSSTGDDGTAIYISDLTTPVGDHQRWLVLVRDGAEILRTTDFDLQLAESKEKTRKSGYPIPKSLEFSSPELKGSIEAMPPLVAVDPLDAIPQPFRFLLSFKMRPHRVWARSTFKLRLRTDSENTETFLQGSGILTTTFLNPLPHAFTRSNSSLPGA